MSATTPTVATPTRALATAARQLFTLVLLLIGLWLLHLNLRVAPEAVILALWIGATLLIGYGGFRRHRLRRAAFLRGYLDANSPWSTRLRGGPLMALRHLLVGALLGGLLILALARIQTPAVWAVLVVGALTLVVLEAGFSRLVAGHAHPRLAPELARRGALWITGGGLTLALLVLALRGWYPDLSGASLEQVIWFMVEHEGARSAVLEIGLQLAAAQDGLRLWLGQQWLPPGAQPLPVLLAWSLLLLEQAFLAAGFLLLANGLFPPRDPGDDPAQP